MQGEDLEASVLLCLSIKALCLTNKGSLKMTSSKPEIHELIELPTVTREEVLTEQTTCRQCHFYLLLWVLGFSAPARAQAFALTTYHM